MSQDWRKSRSTDHELKYLARAPSASRRVADVGKGTLSASPRCPTCACSTIANGDRTPASATPDRSLVPCTSLRVAFTECID